jgi:ACR3 family arsenite efflux pump ArsB
MVLFFLKGCAELAYRSRAFVEYLAENLSFRELPLVSVLLTSSDNLPYLTSISAILVGLLVMMWPVLTKVQYERLPIIFKRRSIWLHIGVSIILNWILAPCLMLALAWATLPDLERERKGVILVGIARCIGQYSYN